MTRLAEARDALRIALRHDPDDGVAWLQKGTDS
jgi:hypothetical protein